VSCKIPLKSQKFAADKSRSGSYTRESLLAAYGLSDKTLRRLLEYGIATPKAETRHGRVFYVVDEATDARLRLGCFCPWSFDKFRPPFLRYVLFGMLTVPIDDILAGLDARGIRHKIIDREWLEEVESSLIRRLPNFARPFVQSRLEPVSPLQRDLHRQLLRLAGVELLYDQPMLLEEFFFEDEPLRHFITQAVHTHSASMADKAALINEGLGREVINPEGLLLWEAYFQDRSVMREEDIARYLRGVPPVYRDAYRTCMTLSASDWAIQSKLLEDTKLELQQLSRKLKHGALENILSGDREAQMHGMRMASTAMKVDDGIGRVRGVGDGPLKDVPEHLRDITPAEYCFEDRLQSDPKDKSASGSTA